MNTYEVLYIRGFDHDDWDKLTVTAFDEAQAKSKAQDRVPRGCRLKKIKLIQTSAETRINPCNMDSTKIQNLTPQGSFEANGKTFHKFDCILENGMVGEVNALTPDKWKVGDEVVVKEHQATKWGPRLKLDKPGFSGGGFTAKSGGSDETTKGIVASWAVGCAMQAAGDPAQEHYDSVVLQLARLALSARNLIKEEVEL